MTWIDELYATLGRRAAPEQVARIILASGIRWPADVQVRLARVVSARASWYVSSMSEDFERADDCGAQLAAAGRMFGVDVSGVSPADVGAISALITELGQRLGGWRPGRSGRVPGPARRAVPCGSWLHSRLHGAGMGAATRNPSAV